MKKHRKLLTLGVVICLVAGLVAGIVYYKQVEEERKLSLIYIPKVVDGTNDFWTSLIQGAEMAAKEYNADIRVWAPEEENDVAGQNKLIERAIEEKPDAILISPSSFTESDQLLKKAKEQGIHIAFIDSYTQEEVQDLTVATDNLEAGQILGRFAKDLVGTDDQIAIVSHVKGVSTAVEREKGFRTGLGSLKDNIVDVVYCDSQYDKSYELTKELMKKYPEQIGVLASLPLETVIMKVVYREMMLSSLSGWITLWIDPVIYVQMFVIGIVTYAVIALLEYRKIQKVPMSEALKNVE